MWDILGWVLLGVLSGVVARRSMPEESVHKELMTILVGVLGSLVGGVIGRFILGYGGTDTTGQILEPNFFLSLLIAIIGSLVFLGLYKLLTVVLKGARSKAVHA